MNTDLKEEVRKTEKSRIYWWWGGGRKAKGNTKVNSKENKIALYPKDK